MAIFALVKRLMKIFRQTNIGILIIATVFIIILGTFGSYFAEHSINNQFNNLGDGIWWTVVTMSTVGYGDKFPITVPGRIIGTICMVSGPVLMVSLIGSLGVTFYERWMKGVKGMNQVKKKGHIIISNWNKKTEDILRELRAGALCDLPIIIIDDGIETKPTDDANVFFVKGNAAELATLIKANITEAKFAIVLAENNTPIADQKTVLTVLAIEKNNPDIFTCAELIDANNEEHLRAAGCDIVINASMLSSRLLAMSLQNPSIHHIITEFISQEGNEIHRVHTPQEYIGRPFLDVLLEIKKLHSIITIGIERDGKSLINPPASELTKSGDILLLISEETPVL